MFIFSFSNISIYLQGSLKWPGDYTECINSTAAPQASNWTAKYCAVSNKGKLKPFDDDMFKMNYGLTVGICSPTQCSTDDIVAILNTRKNQCDLDTF